MGFNQSLPLNTICCTKQTIMRTTHNVGLMAELGPLILLHHNISVSTGGREWDWWQGHGTAQILIPLLMYWSL